MCELCVEKARLIKEKSEKVWDGTAGVHRDSADLTGEEIAALLQEDSEWEFMNEMHEH